MQKIQNAESKLAELEKGLEETRVRVAAQQELTQALKVELAQELKDVLQAPPAAKVAKKGSHGGDRRVRGVSAAIIGLLADGQIRDTDAIKHALGKQGLEAPNLSITLSVLAKKGRIVRVGRGQYQGKA